MNILRDLLLRINTKAEITGGVSEDTTTSVMVSPRYYGPLNGPRLRKGQRLKWRGKTWEVVGRYDVQPRLPMAEDEEAVFAPSLGEAHTVKDLRRVDNKEDQKALVPTVINPPAVQVHVPAPVVEVHVAGASITVPQSSIQVHVPETRLEPKIEIHIDLVGALKELLSGLKEAVVIHVAAPQITVNVPEQPPAQITVNVPEQPPAKVEVTVEAAPAPNVEVHVEKQDAPIVNVTVPEQPPAHVEVTVQAAPAPNVEVNVPAQAPPVVQVNVPEAAPAQIHVSPEITVVAPEQKPVEKTIQYDVLTGRISKVIERPVD